MKITNRVVTYPDGGPIKYWVGGSGDWNDILHWSDTPGGEGGATIPRYANTVIVDDNSVKVGEDTLVITWSDIVYCEFLTTTITTPCLFNAIATINVTDAVSLSETTTMADTVYISDIDTTVYWTLVDNAWTYMDIYYYTETDWNNTSPAQLQDRQVQQYTAWREYCQDPVTGDLPQIVSTTHIEAID
jgi:hypothetical protein